MMEASLLPLTGVRVVDLTTTFAGPQAARVLAELGAYYGLVIKTDNVPYRLMELFDEVRKDMLFEQNVPFPQIVKAY